MELAMIGLGKMGGNMVARLLKGGHRVIAFDVSPEAVKKAVEMGAEGANSLEEAVKKLKAPRVFWVMVPSGEITDKTIHALADLAAPGDILIDGGNSYYKDSLRHAAELKEKGLHFVDVGTSGGVWGLKEGYSLMIGGDEKVVAGLTPIFTTLAPAADQGWGRVGPAGAGHFTKMVHNGIEYGLMQAYAEGFEIMHAKKEFNLDLAQISEIWRYGSVVRSWLLDLTAGVLKEDASLDDLEAYVPDSGEGRWTVAEAIDLDVAAPIITLSLQRRIRSRQAAPFGDKLLSAMRNAFGGHAVKKAK
jgi:6-phosphogluconate dehydrogenase (decarboxylating)